MRCRRGYSSSPLSSSRRESEEDPEEPSSPFDPPLSKRAGPDRELEAPGLRLLLPLEPPDSLDFPEPLRPLAFAWLCRPARRASSDVNSWALPL
jgi:hypothetical protein